MATPSPTYEINSDLIMKLAECPYNLSRNSSTDLALPKPNKDFGKRCFNYSAAVLWNNPPYQAIIAPTV